jgi:hypothetical protein
VNPAYENSQEFSAKRLKMQGECERSGVSPPLGARGVVAASLFRLPRSGLARSHDGAGRATAAPQGGAGPERRDRGGEWRRASRQRSFRGWSPVRIAVSILRLAQCSAPRSG